LKKNFRWKSTSYGWTIHPPSGTARLWQRYGLGRCPNAAISPGTTWQASTS
jgi:hypothetical protein